MKKDIAKYDKALQQKHTGFFADKNASKAQQEAYSSLKTEFERVLKTVDKLLKPE
jgi:hypothetical protein